MAEESAVCVGVWEVFDDVTCPLVGSALVQVLDRGQRDSILQEWKAHHLPTLEVMGQQTYFNYNSPHLLEGSINFIKLLTCSIMWTHFMRKPYSAVSALLTACNINIRLKFFFYCHQAAGEISKATSFLSIIEAHHDDCQLQTDCLVLPLQWDEIPSSQSSGI